MAYVVPPINANVRAAMGDSVFTVSPVFVFESVMPAPYISELMGMTMESGVAAPRVQSGEILNTARGEFVTVQFTTTNDAGESVTQEVVQVDVGAGAEQLQTVVAAEPVATFDQEIVEVPAQPFYSENAVSTNPYESQSIEYYVHLEVPQAESVNFTVGSSAYGELDINGNPVQTTQTTDPSNLEAQYNGL